MCITWPHICFTIHLLWCMIYIIIGSVQLVSGVFFLVPVPLLKLGSNICVGTWNILFGVGGAVIALIGEWTLQKQRTFLYLSVSVLLANVVNLVVLEIAEWHIFLPEAAKKLTEQGNLNKLVLYARTLPILSTIVAAVISFFDSQITFCSMQYHERVYQKKSSEKQDILSDTEYVLPRVKSDSDDNENASYFAKQYPQSWVFDAQTAETSTINSVPNRFSQASEENVVVDSKQTSSETEFKDISTQNLNVEQPVVVVENTADYTDRQLHYMATFSRTPSPVAASESSSEDSCSIHGGPPIQESLEKLTEPTIYKSRLDSALSTNTPINERPTPSMSPRPPSISAIEQLQHDSLMVELQETISNKSVKLTETGEPKETAQSPPKETAILERSAFSPDTIRSPSSAFGVFSPDLAPSTIKQQQPSSSSSAATTPDIAPVSVTSSAITPETEEEGGFVNGDGESVHSNNVSTDKETIIEFKSDDEVEMPCHEQEEEPPPLCVGVCDTLDLIEGIRAEPAIADNSAGVGAATAKNGNKIDSIFKIAENVETIYDYEDTIIRDVGGLHRTMDPLLEESREDPTSESTTSDSGQEAVKPDLLAAQRLSARSPMERREDSDVDNDEDKDSVRNIEPINADGDSIDIPPPELDHLSTDQETDSSDFIIPPPEEHEDEEALNNGVDPEEWEESDDDSVDSSCVQRVPPTTTPNE